MAFGINRSELTEWKRRVKQGEIALITHYWIHPKFPQYRTLTKAGCSDLEKLAEWGEQYGLKREWIHLRSSYPHFDLIGSKQREILFREQKWDQLKRFGLI